MDGREFTFAVRAHGGALRILVCGSLLAIWGCAPGELSGPVSDGVCGGSACRDILLMDGAPPKLDRGAPADGPRDTGKPADTSKPNDAGKPKDTGTKPQDGSVDPTDAATPDLPAGSVVPVVYGAYGSPGNQVCKHLHPPATKPCHLHTLKWLKDIYGIQLTWAPAAEVSKAGKVYRLVEYAEREGPVAIEVWVVDETGAKLANTLVTFCYPVVKGSGTSLTCSANKVAVKVKAQGHADFTMTGSGYTKCGQPGPYAAWIDEPGVPSDKVYGLGMLGGTNHRHINLIFQRVKAGKPAKDATRCPLAE